MKRDEETVAVKKPSLDQRSDGAESLKPSVTVIGWRVGFDKVEFTKLLRRAAGGLSLTTAKAMTDQVVDGKPVEVAVTELQIAQFIASAENIGAIVRHDVLVRGTECR